MGYIKEDKKLKEIWGRKLKKTPNKKLIGIHWQGNPDFEKKLYTKGRSMDVKYLQALSNIGNTEFIYELNIPTEE